MSKQFTEILYYIKKYLAFHFQENGEKKTRKCNNKFYNILVGFCGKYLYITRQSESS